MAAIISNKSILEDFATTAKEKFSFLKTDFHFLLGTEKIASGNLYTQLTYSKNSLDIEIYYEFRDGYVSITSNNSNTDQRYSIFKSTESIQDILKLNQILTHTANKVRGMIEKNIL